ncbi:hypothetical protein EJ04DRAFT_576958 [Polyplosphaeria fusca]|uniref:Uncharacterized protein n=1 Tax=Polyplosphaeria fusca TaxID=682080 RepID=A0A9P4QV58_9PLEO|nr:hypothetical protein EJ04DRAFT_576958 [Polyplosphaeria fusca]
MHVPTKTCPILACLALSSVLVNGKPTLVPRQDDGSLLLKHLTNYAGGWAIGACADNNDFGTPELRDNIWYHGHSGDLVEYFLRNEGVDKHDTVDWAQEMFKILFPNKDPAQMSCNGSSTQCGVGNMDCKKDFNSDTEARFPAAFYTFVSLGNIHTFFSQYLERLSWMKGNLTNNLPILVDDFGADKESSEKLNPWAIVAAALGTLAGVTAPVAPVSGTFGAMGGIAGMIANTQPGESALETLGQLKSNLATIIGDVCETSYKNIVAIQDAIHGRTSEDKIPKEMLFIDDYNKDYQHPIAQVMGKGAWLLDHPAQDLRANFDEVGKRMMQTLGLQLTRLFHKSYLLILTNAEADKCKDGNFAWHSEENLCYVLVSVAKKGEIGDLPQWSLQDDGSFAKPLWEKYGAGKLAMYQNIIDCWVNNDSQVGTPDLSAMTPGTDINRCFFSVEVKKGKINTDTPFGGPKYIDLVPEEEFPNFSGADKINNGGFPKSCKSRDWKECSQWPLRYDL